MLLTIKIMYIFLYHTIVLYITCLVIYLCFFVFQVLQSDGLDRTRILAREHCDSALSAIEYLADSKYKWALASLTDSVINRLK